MHPLLCQSLHKKRTLSPDELPCPLHPSRFLKSGKPCRLGWTGNTPCRAENANAGKQLSVGGKEAAKP